MKRAGPSLTTLAVLSFVAGPALAQQSNANKPAAPAPSKAAPLDTGGKPEATKSAGGGGAMMKKSGGGMMKKHHSSKHHH